MCDLLAAQNVAIACKYSTSTKVLWTRKAPACLRTVVYAYGKPHVCINIHHYAPQRIVLQHAGAVDAALRALSAV